MAVPRWIRSACVMSLCIVLLSCDDSPTGDGMLGEPLELFRISGTVQNNTGAPIPENARLVIAWIVFAGPTDYTYAFGDGFINPAGTFSIDLLPPPSTALNAGAYGVGLPVATTSTRLTQGDDLNDFPIDDFIGAAGDYAIVYITDPTAAAWWSPWTADFEAGYGVGRGQRVPGSFDIFVPTSPDSLVLILDDIGNIQFFNWR